MQRRVGREITVLKFVLHSRKHSEFYRSSRPYTRSENKVLMPWTGVSNVFSSDILGTVDLDC